MHICPNMVLSFLGMAHETGFYTIPSIILFNAYHMSFDIICLHLFKPELLIFSLIHIS